MARKPHNYTHFQSLVSQLKEQNDNNFAGLSTLLEAQTSILQSLKGAKLKELQQDQADLRKDKENRLEGKKGGKKEIKMPGFLKGGKGIMGGIGQFLSTALLGIPGGLRRFMPRALGIPLMFGLARGMAGLIAGPKLVEALSAAFDQKSFSGGFEAFINSYFTPSGTPYKSLWGAASGGAGMGLLAGLAILGPRGAIMGGILGGALTGLNHIMSEDKSDSKMKSGDVMTKIKNHLMENIDKWAMGAGAIIGAKWGMVGGPAGMIAGAILGAGIGIIGANTITRMMELEKGGAGTGQAFKQGLIDYLKSDEFSAVQNLAPWAGGAAGAAMFAGLGPAGMIAGMILGAGAGIVAGPVLLEALTSKEGAGKGLAKVASDALWDYLKSSKYLRGGLFGAALFGGAGALGLGPVGMIAGAIIGAVMGVLVTWLTYAVSDFVGPRLAKVFGLDHPDAEKVSMGRAGHMMGKQGIDQLEEIEKRKKIVDKLYGKEVKRSSAWSSMTYGEEYSPLTMDLISANPKQGVGGRSGRSGFGSGKKGTNMFGVMENLKETYLGILKKDGIDPSSAWSNKHQSAANKASRLVKSGVHGSKELDSIHTNELEATAIRILAAQDAYQRAKTTLGNMHREGGNGTGPTVNLAEGDKNWKITQILSGTVSNPDLTNTGVKDLLTE
jgi:hypothetical protein